MDLHGCKPAGSIALGPPGLTEQSLAINFPKMRAPAQKIPQLSRSRIIVVLLCTHTPPTLCQVKPGWIELKLGVLKPGWLRIPSMASWLKQLPVGECVRPSTSAAHFRTPPTYRWCPVPQHKAQVVNQDKKDT